MDLQAFQHQLLEKGKTAGFTDMEVYIQGGQSISVRIFKGEVDHYANSVTRGVSFRGLYNGKMGYAFSEIISDEAVESLIHQAKENASIIEDDEVEEIYQGDSEYVQIQNYNESLKEVPLDIKINAAKQMEKSAFAVDTRVKGVNYCMFAYGEGESTIANTKGLQIQDSGNYAYAYISVQVEGNNVVKTGDSYWVGRDFSAFDPKKVGEEAAKEALANLNASSLTSGKYPILLRNDVAAVLLQTYAGVFFANSVQKGFSLLQGKIGEKIASSLITIRDDAHYPDGLGSTAFDSEGVATQNTVVVQDGILKTFLHNRKTAKKDGVKSTGNGFKGSYKSTVEISATNYYIVPGSTPRDKMIEQMEKGILITDVAGLHSGTNSVSGDFSLAASGFLIENGKIIRPVDQITIAGNFFTLLQEIEEVGSDLRFYMPGGSGTMGAPTLRIKELSVAGSQA